MNKLPTLSRRHRFGNQKSVKVKPRRSPKINRLRVVLNGSTILCAIACFGLILYGIYLAIPYIGYGIWLSIPCFVVAAIVALIGASLQAFLQSTRNRE
jgi:fatty acid desaturase